MSHSYVNNDVHFVYSTKNRENLIPPEFEPRLYSFVAEIAREHRIPLLAAGGMPNHSHLLVLLPATQCLADVINVMKTNSSRFMSQARHRLRMANRLWSIQRLRVASEASQGLHSQSEATSQEDDVRRRVHLHAEESGRGLRSQIRFRVIVIAPTSLVPRLRRSDS
ncbi:MAG TPA: transposase [Terriglobales bacterium]|nr:transposase [Terriglobales bacterium]